MNKLTVAICAYNAERYIEETLKAIKNQTFKSFDILVIDDCSIDKTIDIIERSLEGYEYRLVKLRQNKGIANARQLAIKIAISEYLIFIDADDIPAKNLLEEEFRVISTDNNIILVSSWLKFIDKDGKNIRGGFFKGFDDREDFINKASKGKLIFLPIHSMFHRKSALKVGGFTLEGFPLEKPRYRDYCEDLDLWCRMSDLYKDDKYMITIPQVLYSYRKCGSGLSADTLQMVLKMKYIKQNIRNRRKGDSELTFMEYLENLSLEDIDELKQESKVMQFFSNGIILISKGSFLKGLYFLLKVFIKKPTYFYQKLITNFIK